MRGLWTLFGGQVGDLVLVGSLVTAPPAWLGSIELLSALGLDGALAAIVSGLYVWGRIGLSGAVLIRRAQRGELTLSVDGLLDAPRESLAGTTRADLPFGITQETAVRPATDGGVPAETVSTED